MLVNIRLPSPLGTRAVIASPTDVAAVLLEELDLPFTDACFLRTRSGIVAPSTPLGALAHSSTFPVDLELVPRVLGGKGGFGANLRAAGGRMNASKSTNFDSCRDLSGRRLGALKEAQRQADLVESLPDLKAKAAAEDKAKLEKIERQLGVSAADDSAEGSKRLAEVDLEELARKKHKFDDDKFLEESREIKENVRSAVGMALLKKKKKKAAAAAAEEKKDDKVASAASKAKLAAKTAAKAKVAA